MKNKHRTAMKQVAPQSHLQMNKTALHWLLHTALSYLGTPYIWGGDDPAGFDCSGFVIECLQSAGLLPDKIDLTAQGLREHFADCRVQTPQPGALLFQLDTNGRAYHVVICLDEYFCIGANSGTSATMSVEGAWKMNAFVKIRPIDTFEKKWVE